MADIADRTSTWVFSHANYKKAKNPSETFFQVKGPHLKPQSLQGKDSHFKAQTTINLNTTIDFDTNLNTNLDLTNI